MQRYPVIDGHLCNACKLCYVSRIKKNAGKCQSVIRRWYHSEVYYRQFDLVYVQIFQKFSGFEGKELANGVLEYIWGYLNSKSYCK